MSEIVFTGCYEPLKEQEIIEFEQWLGSHLPLAYREFLARNNGGHPHKPNLLHPLSCYVQFFFPLTSVHSDRSIKSEIEKLREQFPADLIPICLSGTGDRLCLSLFDGKIYYYEYEHEVKALRHGFRTSPDRFVYLAKDINELLDNLTGDEPSVPDEEVDKIGRWGDVQLLDEYIDRGCNINHVTARGNSIVLSAAYEGNQEFIKECVKRGAVLSHQGVLHAAIFCMNYDLVEYLLNQGIDPNEKDNRGKTPLDVALPPAKGPAVQLLKSRGGMKSV